MIEFPEQMVRTLPLQPLHKPTDRDLRRDRNHQVDVILAHVASHDLHVLLAANLADHVPHAVSHQATQQWLAVLRRPDEVQVNLEDGVRTVPVAHEASLCRSSVVVNLLKLSPKGEGFNPPKDRQ